MNWSDLRAFLAVSQLGSLRQAAEMLGVTQPTISRRIQMLEADLGISLFERTRAGHKLTKAGADLLPEVRMVETAALRVEQRSLGLLNQLTETIRVGVVAGETAAEVLARGLNNNPEGPNIELVDIKTPASENLHAPEIIVQHHMPDAGDGFTRRVGTIDCGIYGSANFAEGRTLPLAPVDLVTLPWLGYLQEQEHYVTMRWLGKQMRDRPPVARLMNTSLMTTAARSGIGVAALPCFIGNSSPDLIQLSAPIEALRSNYWIIIHHDLSRNPSVRSVADWISKCFRAV